MDVSRPPGDRQLRRALANLHDVGYLAALPLARGLEATPGAGGNAGRRLQRRLLEAIEALRPDPKARSEDRANRPYRLLVARYVQGQAIAGVCRELGISQREFYRTHDRGLAALQTLLEPSALAEAGSRETGAVLPGPSSSFIGRRAELAALRRLLARHRLVTITGPGGSGKTRLAVELAARLDPMVAAPGDSCSVRFMDLGAIAPTRPVAAAVATALGVAEEPRRPPLATLAETLRQQRLLLVLDNCEHLAEPCAEMVSALLDGCSRLRILATSREPLGVDGEALYALAPLQVPSSDTDRPAAILATEAVRLFRARAATARSDLTIGPRQAMTVAEVCRRLDGLPLAIELAAARLRVLSLDDLASELAGDGRFRVLVAGRRTAPARHQTLRASVDASYEPLDPDERRLFEALSVFAGGFTLEAAEWVGNAADRTLDLLARLVDRSLTVAEPGRDGRTRYRLLETLRQYADERLDARGQSDAVRRRHAEWCLALAEAADAGLRGPAQAACLRRLEDERANLEAALSWSAVSTDPEPVGLGLRLGAALGWYWFAHGRPQEGLTWLRRLLALPGGDRPSAARGWALYAAGLVAVFVDGAHSAARLRREALEVFHQIHDRRGMAYTLAVDPSQLDDYTTYCQRASESLTMSDELRDRWGRAWALANWGRVAVTHRDFVRGRALLEEALARFRDLGDRASIARVVDFLGVAAAAAGELARARTLYEEQLAINRELGDRWRAGRALVGLGGLSLEQDDPAVAQGHFAEALRIFLELGVRSLAASAFNGLAAVAAQRSKPTTALRLAGAASALYEATGTTALVFGQLDVTQWLAAAERSLDPATRAAAWQAGRVMSLEEAVAVGLSEAPGAAGS